MVTFMPIAVGKNGDFILGIKDSDRIISGNLTYGKVYSQNSALDVDGDGRITKAEAVGFIERIHRWISNIRKKFSSGYWR